MDQITIAIDALLGADASGLAMNELLVAIGELTELRAVVDSLWLSVVARVEAEGVAPASGYRTTADLIAASTGDDRAAATRDVRLGLALDSAPAIAHALRSGHLTRTKAKELVRAEGASNDECARLIAFAKTASVRKVHFEVERFRAEQGIESPPKANSLTIDPHRGTIKAQLDPLRLNQVQIAIDLAVAKLGHSKDVPYEQRRVDALVAVCAFFVEHVDNATTNRGVRPHISAIVDIETLAGLANRPATLENGAYLSGEAARRLACDAGLSRIITGGKSQTLDVGTETRVWSAAMSKAIIARDKHCVHDGCEAPPWACQIHHKDHVAHHGPTSVANGELRCWFHHDHQHELDEEAKRQQRQQRQQHERNLDNASLAA
jgi:hypothetical protein